MRVRPLVLSLASLAATVASASAADVRGEQKAFDDWKTDKPGVERVIKLSDLPPPKEGTQAEEKDMENRSKVIPWAQGKLPKVPEGFTVRALLTGLKKPRTMRVAPNGDVFLAEVESGRILVISAGDIGGRDNVKPKVFADRLTKPYGIAFYPAGPKPEFVYVSEPSGVMRYEYTVGDTKARGKAETIVGSIPTNRHWTRDLAVIGNKFYVAIGSGSNIAGEMPYKALPDVKRFERKQGLGAAWGPEEGRAVVREFDPLGRRVRNFATGLRNCSGLGVQPRTNALWCVVNERDHLGDNVPSEFATRVRAGAFYGWPWYYNGANEDPRLAGKRPDLRKHVAAPDVLMQAHTAPLGITFYENDLFPPEYRGGAFVTMHGSWNRTAFAGYKVVYLPFAKGRATGAQQDFMTGFIANDKEVYGRPAGIAVAQDGSLLVSEDGNGTVFRVTYK